MIELRRIVLLNWHLLTRADLDLAGDGAVLGQNRSGKSTLIDLIQAVFAGGSARLFRFNRSAGEGGGRSDRTLAGYCLGQLNEDTFLRNEARSHIALVFEDSSGTKLPVSIGLAIEASRGQQAEVVGHFIAEGVRLDTGMLLDEAANGLRPTDWPVPGPKMPRRWWRTAYARRCAKLHPRIHAVALHEAPHLGPGTVRPHLRCGAFVHGHDLG
jgi:hypothetical protein